MASFASVGRPEPLIEFLYLYLCWLRIVLSDRLSTKQTIKHKFIVYIQMPTLIENFTCILQITYHYSVIRAHAYKIEINFLRLYVARHIVVCLVKICLFKSYVKIQLNHNENKCFVSSLLFIKFIKRMTFKRLFI